MKLCLAIFFICNLAMAQDRIGNGANPGERNFLIALRQLPLAIAAVLSQSPSRLTHEERQLLGRIAHALPLELQNPNILVFSDHEQDPQIFNIHGTLKVAVTGNHIGDTIYVNRKLINASPTLSQIHTYNVFDAMAVLVHEFGHHHQVMDHDWLDQIGTYVAQASPRSFFDYRFSNHVVSGRSLQGYSYLVSGTEQGDVLLVSNSNYLSLNELVRPLIFCTSSHPKLQDMSIKHLTVEELNDDYEFVIHYKLETSCLAEDGSLLVESNSHSTLIKTSLQLHQSGTNVVMLR